MITRLETGLAKIVDISNADIYVPMAAALKTANDAFNIYVKPNIEMVTTALERTKAVLLEIAYEARTFQWRYFEFYGTAFTGCMNNPYIIYISDVVVGKLTQLLSELQNDFSDITMRLTSALDFYQRMRMAGSWVDYIPTCHYTSMDPLPEYAPHVQTLEDATGLCFDRILDMLIYISIFTNNLEIPVVEFVRSVDMVSYSIAMQTLIRNFYPMWDQFEYKTGGLKECLLEFQTLIEESRDWISSHASNSHVKLNSDYAVMATRFAQIKEFFEECEEKYNSYKLAMITEADLSKWFSEQKDSLYADFEDLRIQISQNLFNVIIVRISDTEATVSKLYTEGLIKILTLSSYYNVTNPEVDVFKEIAMVAEMWRKPQAQINSASVISFELNPQEALSFADSSIGEYERMLKMDNLNTKSVMSPFTPLLYSYFQGMRDALLPMESKLMKDIHNAASSIEAFENALAKFQNMELDTDFLRYLALPIF